MPPERSSRFVTITATDWGQGKTDTALELAIGLRRLGYKVGGFSIRRSYLPSEAGFLPHALEVLLFSTGQSIRVARQGFPDDEPLDFRTGRHQGLRIGMEGTFYLNRAALADVHNQALRDLQDPAVTAYIVDEVGPLLFKTNRPRRGRQRQAPFYDLVLALVDHPKPFTCLIFSDPDMQSEDVVGIRRHIQAHPSRLQDRILNWRLTQENFRVLAGEILEQTPTAPRGRDA